MGKRGRPREKFKGKVRTFKLSDPEYEALRGYCRKKKITIGEQIRRWVRREIYPFMCERLERRDSDE